jgi:uncharacterized protein YegP (UPF0339 family)
MMLKPRIEESPKDGQFRVAFLGGNNERWFTSEGYTREEDAVRSFDDFISAILDYIANEDGVLQHYNAAGEKVEYGS